MKGWVVSRAQASNVRVDQDETGGMAEFDWTCPHCGQLNPEFMFSADFMTVSGDFETDCECG